MNNEIKKNKLPKKNNDINNIRCIVLGVLNHFKLNASLLCVSQSIYETYIDALLEAKVLLREKGRNDYNIESFLIFDENKIDEYKKTSFYKFIEKRVAPLFKNVGSIKGIIK